MRAAALGVLIAAALTGAVPTPPSPATPQVAAPSTLDNSEPIPYFISDGSGVPGRRPSDDELARAAFAAWARESEGRLRFVETDSEDEALVQLVWIAPGGGLYGEMRRVLVDGQPRSIVYVTPGIEGQGAELARRTREDPLLRDVIVYLTCVHELGHAVGLPHTSQFEDIMYSFAFGGDIVDYFMRYRRLLQDRADIARNSGLSSGDRAVLGRLYGSD